MKSVEQQATAFLVKRWSFNDKGMKNLYAENSAKGVPPQSGDQLHKRLAFLDDMQHPGELRAHPTWKAHTLAGDRTNI